MIRWPEIIREGVKNLGWEIGHASYELEEFLKNHPLDTLRQILFIPLGGAFELIEDVIEGIFEAPRAIFFGVVQGLELSGFTQIWEQFGQFLEYLKINIKYIIKFIKEKLDPVIKVFNRVIKKIVEVLEPFVRKLVNFLDKISVALRELWRKVARTEWKCSRIMSSTTCEAIFHASRKVVDPLFDTINSMGYNFLQFIVTALDDLSWNSVRPKFHKYCSILLPSFVCDFIIHFVEDIDRFAQRELHEFLPYAEHLIEEIEHWIRTHIWDDGPSILRKIASQ